MLPDDLAHGRNLTREEALGARRMRPRGAAAGSRAAARRRARLDRLVFAQGLHSADASFAATFAITARSLIRRAGTSRHISRSTRCSPSRAPGRRQAARRRCSRSATSRSCATAPPPMSLPASDIDTTLSYLAEAARAVIEQTGLLPHLNPGHLTPADVAALRAVSVSQGLMLESASERLCERGGPHHGSPDKHPRARLASIRAAGEQRVPFTSGILIGIGETREERIDSLLALRELNDAHGHIQEIIIQNFRPKPGTRMADAPAPSSRRAFVDDRDRTVVVCAVDEHPGAPQSQPGRAAPPASMPASTIGAGCRRSRPIMSIRRRRGRISSCSSAPRMRQASNWSNVWRSIRHSPAAPTHGSIPALRTPLLRRIDADGWPRTDEWSPGTLGRAARPRFSDRRRPAIAGEIPAILAKAQAGDKLGEADIVRLFRARGEELAAVCSGRRRAAASRQRRRRFLRRHPQHQLHQHLLFQMPVLRLLQRQDERESARPAVRSPAQEVERRVREAWARGATEVCMQGGIHPSYTGAKYLDICRTVKSAAPGIHIHAFSPLEVQQGASDARRPGRGIPCRRCRSTVWARCRARPRKSSTMRCAPCFARTRSAPANGSR